MSENADPPPALSTGAKAEDPEREPADAFLARVTARREEMRMQMRPIDDAFLHWAKNLGRP